MLDARGRRRGSGVELRLWASWRAWCRGVCACMVSRRRTRQQSPSVARWRNQRCTQTNRLSWRRSQPHKTPLSAEPCQRRNYRGQLGSFAWRCTTWEFFALPTCVLKQAESSEATVSIPVHTHVRGPQPVPGPRVEAGHGVCAVRYGVAT